MNKNKINRSKTILILILILIISAPLWADTDSQELLDRRISLSVENSPIEDVIRLLARQNGFNVSIAGENLGEVSFILEDVPLSEALNAILGPNKLTWYIRKNIIVIKDAATVSMDELKTIIYNLKYVSAKEAQIAGTPLLTKEGHIEILAEAEGTADAALPTKIVISDRVKNVDEILNVIEDLDQPPPQLNIAVKLVETTLTSEDKLGIDWPESYGATLGGLIDEETGLLHSSTYPLEGGDWVWGKFNTDEIRVALDLLLQRGNSRILSDPNLTTVSNKPAEISVTTTIPIQTINRFTEGAVIQDLVTFQDLNIGITLRVIGRINEDSILTLKVNPVIEEIIGYTGPPDDLRPITSNRAMSTEVRVMDSETLVMGGLLKENSFENTKKLPLLGSIPILGRVFQHKSTKKEKTDLTIFITPRIVRPQSEFVTRSEKDVE